MVDTLYHKINPDHTVIVVGALTGHDLFETLRPLRRLSTRAYAVRSHHPRAESAQTVATALQREGFTVLGTDDSIANAMHVASAEAAGSRRQKLIATGSLSVVAEVIAFVKGISFETYPTIRGQITDQLAPEIDSSHTVR